MRMLGGRSTPVIGPPRQRARTIKSPTLFSRSMGSRQRATPGPAARWKPGQAQEGSVRERAVLQSKSDERK